MGLVAWIFKFPPSEIFEMDDMDLIFWQSQAEKIIKSMSKK